MRLLISLTLLASVMLIIFGFLFYSFAKSNAMKLQEESTSKVLKQVNYNIDHLYATVTNLTISSFSNQDISVLMQSRDLDIFDLYNRLQKFDYLVNTNLFLDSVIIYNSHNGCYYISPQSSPVQCEKETISNPLQQYMSLHHDFPNLKLLPIHVSDGKKDRQLLTDFYQEQGSVLMVNVKPQWLFDNIQSINGLADSMLGEIMIFDANNALLTKDSDNSSVQQDMIASLQSKTDTEGTFIIGKGKNKKIVMYTTSAATGWKLVGIQSYQVVFGTLDQIRSFSLLLLSCFIVLSLVASTVISMKLYKPIGSLIQAVRGVPDSQDGMGSSKDELSFLSQFNQRMLEKMVKLESGKKATDNIAKDYFLRRLLLERQTMNLQEFSDQVRLHGLKLVEQSGAYIVCLLSISGNKSQEGHLLKFAVQNIAEEMLSAITSNESILLGNEFVTLLLSVPESKLNKIEAELPSIIGNLQEVVRNYYKIGICASVSSVVHHHEQISEAYGQALLQFEYRIIYGTLALITPERIAINERSEVAQLDYQMEKKWLESVRSANLKTIELQLIPIFKQLSTFRHDHLIQTLQYLTSITVNHLKEMNLDKAHSVKASLISFNRRVLEQETLDHIFVLYMELFQQITESRQTSTEDKNRILVDALKEAIEKHYSDPNLSLQFLATKLKMSTAHLSKVFKQSESISLNDYINKVRIMQAVAELQNTDVTITQIMYNVGFVSESYFYKIFKQSLGLTPRELRTKHVLSNE